MCFENSLATVWGFASSISSLLVCVEKGRRGSGEWICSEWQLVNNLLISTSLRAETEKTNTSGLPLASNLFTNFFHESHAVWNKKTIATNCNKDANHLPKTIKSRSGGIPGVSNVLLSMKLDSVRDGMAFDWRWPNKKRFRCPTFYRSFVEADSTLGALQSGQEFLALSSLCVEDIECLVWLQS